MQRIKAKLVMLGTQGVGKTSIAIRYVDKVFSKKSQPTIGATYFPCTIVVDDIKVMLEIWDTAGQERYKAMLIKFYSIENMFKKIQEGISNGKAPLFYRNSDAAILVYDITNSSTFDGVKLWVDELRCKIEEKIVMCVIGNKNDLDDSRQVSFDDANFYAQSIDADYIETSALSNEGISEAFNLVAKSIVNRHKAMQENKMVNCDKILIDEEISTSNEYTKSNSCC